VKEVQAFVQDKPQLGFALILQLTGVNGNQQFDKFTKTKTVESVLASLDAQGIKNYIDYILTQTDESDGEYVVQYLLL
jgi:DNA polymerase phi